MVGEKPPFFSFEDGYLRVADVCGRAEYLERLAHYHALGKLRVSGRPNGPRAERRDIPVLGLIDYRLAFGTDGRDAMAVHKNLAAEWLHDGRSIAHLLAGGPPPRSTPAPEPGRRLLAESDTEIDDRAWRAIRRAITAARARAKPDDASLVFTDLRMGAREFLKIVKAFGKPPSAAPSAARALTAAEVRGMLSKIIIGEEERGKTFSQKKAVSLVQNIDPQYTREVVRGIMQDLTNNRPRGRPKLIGGK